MAQLCASWDRWPDRRPDLLQHGPVEGSQEERAARCWDVRHFDQVGSGYMDGDHLIYVML